MIELFENKKNNNFFNFLTIVLTLLFVSIFILSYLKVINFWSFSQAHVNYFEGYVRRGLFGTIMLSSENFFGISTRFFFSSFFVIFYTINILLFLKLAAQYKDNKILIFFIIFNPTLVLFPFNDLGGYARFDIISIILVLLHAYFINNFLNNNINEDKYLFRLKWIIIPMIVISLLIHEIQIFTLPFHFLLTLNILKQNFFKTLQKYLILLPIILFISFFHADETTHNLMMKGLSEKGVWGDAVSIQSKKPSLDLYIYGINTNILNFYNFKYHTLMVAAGTLPFAALYIFFKRKKIFSTNYIKKDFLTLILMLAPLLFGLLVGDFGRWVNIMSFVAFAFFAQFPITKKINLEFISYKNISSFLMSLFILLSIFYFVFFIRIPHCCNLQEKQLTLSGGLINKFIAITKTVTKISGDKDYNLDLRFQK
jgi:hypothetical protein